jgi:hypothetical protein
MDSPNSREFGDWTLRIHVNSESLCVYKKCLIFAASFYFN